MNADELIEAVITAARSYAIEYDENSQSRLEEAKAALKSELEKLHAERQSIADSIHVHLDDGTAPDNLADHVSLLMLQEYYPAIDNAQRLTNKLAEKDALLSECSRVIAPFARNDAIDDETADELNLSASNFIDAAELAKKLEGKG